MMKYYNQSYFSDPHVSMSPDFEKVCVCAEGSTFLYASS